MWFFLFENLPLEWSWLFRELLKMCDEDVPTPFCDHYQNQAWRWMLPRLSERMRRIPQKSEELREYIQEIYKVLDIKLSGWELTVVERMSGTRKATRWLREFVEGIYEVLDIRTVCVEANRGKEDEWHQERFVYGQNYWNLLTPVGCVVFPSHHPEQTCTGSTDTQVLNAPGSSLARQAKIMHQCKLGVRYPIF
jgi:hypothetical protein